MDAQVKFKPGDRVRKVAKNGWQSTFSNGQKVVTVDRQHETEKGVWLRETGTWDLNSDLELDDPWGAGSAPVQDEGILARAVAAGYPDDNPKTAVGLTKPSLSAVPPIAMFHLGKAMSDGMRKYGKMNYREKKVSSSIYYDAALRHLMAWYDGEQIASDSGVHHLGHAMACMAILLDAEALGQLNDDRPTPGPLPAFLAANTASAAQSPN
nr:MAG TPA: hypothetical protein [Caudoviricetes sp.]